MSDKRLALAVACETPSDLDLSQDACPPTVSFIVTNFNYGHLIERCLTSIFQQTYPYIECIVVDDASTDGSRDVIRAIAAPPRVKLVRVFNSINLGQTRAAIEGFKLSSGEYIAIVDADDELEPAYALAHVRAHLTVRRPVGFSSCDMATCVNGQVVLNTMFEENGLKLCTDPVKLKDLRKLPSRFEPLFANLNRIKMRYVRLDTLHWVWSPTSGSVYRRDALALFFNNEKMGKLKYATDAYLNFGINSLCGSVLIDETFATYHVHRRNYFSQSARLAYVRAFDPARDFGSHAAFCALEHIVRNFGFFSKKAVDLRHLENAMKTLAKKSAQSSWWLDVALFVARMALSIKWRSRLRALEPRQR